MDALGLSSVLDANSRSAIAWKQAPRPKWSGVKKKTHKQSKPCVPWGKKNGGGTCRLCFDATHPGTGQNADCWQMSNEYILTDVVNAISHVLKFCRTCARRLLAVRYSSIKNIIIWQVSLPYCHVIDLCITGKLQVGRCVFGLPKLFSPLGLCSAYFAQHYFFFAPLHLGACLQGSSAISSHVDSLD